MTSMFAMGFGRSNFQPLPMSLGLSFSDLQEDWKKFYEQAKDIRNVVQSPGGSMTPPPPPPPPPPPSTILGLPASTALIGGAVLLGGGILAAVLLS